MSSKDKTDNVIQFPMDRIKKTNNVVEASDKFSKKNEKEEKPQKPVKTAQKLVEVLTQTPVQTAPVSDPPRLQLGKEAFLQIEMDDGSWWEVPASLFASTKAAQAADRVADELGKEVDIRSDLNCYTTEYMLAMTDDDMLIEWVEKNIKWTDVSSKVRMVRPPDGAEYSKCWSSGMKRVVRR